MDDLTAGGSGERATGTPNTIYDLSSVLFHALEGGASYDTYIEDAEREGDQELAAFFRRVRDEDSARADDARLLLARRTPTAAQTEGTAFDAAATEGTAPGVAATEDSEPDLPPSTEPPPGREGTTPGVPATEDLTPGVAATEAARWPAGHRAEGGGCHPGGRSGPVTANGADQCSAQVRGRAAKKDGRSPAKDRRRAAG
jgi:hypothetical protein